MNGLKNVDVLKMFNDDPQTEPSSVAKSRHHEEKRRDGQREHEKR